MSSLVPKLRPESATTLASLRVVVPLLILLTPELAEGVRVAGLPAALRVAPEGLGWFVRVVPIDVAVGRAAEVVAVFAALLSALGLYTRASLVALLVSATYLFAVADLNGWVWHDVHLLWLTALLAASPCDRALALDAVPGARFSTSYAWPLVFARLLLGAVYFFPGVHKLARSGLAWALSDNLRNQLYWKWLEHGAVPSFRLDEHPLFLHAAGLFVLAFELLFPVLVVARRTRPYAALAGIAFHLCAQLFLLIPFASLWGCYVVCFDMDRVVSLFRKPAGSEVEAKLPRALPVTVGALLLAFAMAFGARGETQAFPFACYPTFEWMPGTLMPDLRISVVGADGRTSLLRHAVDADGQRSQRQWAMVWSLAGALPGGTAPSVDRLRAYLRTLVATDPARALVRSGSNVRFERVLLSVLPEDRDKPPVKAVLLADLPITSSAGSPSP